MIAWSIAQLLVVIYAIRMLWKYLTSGQNKSGLPEPPGPYGVPFLGYLPYLSPHPQVDFAKLGRKYGDIFQVQMDVQKTVVLNSLEVMKEAFGKDVFVGRPETGPFKVMNEHSNYGMVFSTGNVQWKFLRKVSIRALSMFATSKNSRLEAVIDDASEDFHDELAKNDGKLYDPEDPIFDSIAGVVGPILFGGEFDKKDVLLQAIIPFNNSFSNLFSTGSVLDSLPFGWILMRNKVKSFIEKITPINQLVEKYVNEHVIRCEQEDEVCDVADAIALAAKQTPEDVKQQLGLSDHRIRFLAQDLFGAAFHTSLETFRWAINLLAAFPEAQDRARRELAAVCGDRPVRLMDRSKIHYNEALLVEVFRLSSPVPLSVAHTALDDTTLRGFFIPKGTHVFTNLYAHHYNAEIFPDPESFNPERFLTSDGSFDMDLAQLVVPFGVGKRRCVGENLARQELSLLIDRLVQQYEIHQDPNDPVNFRDATPGLTRTPIQTKLIFKKIH